VQSNEQNDAAADVNGRLMMNAGRIKSELERTFSFGPFYLIPIQRLLLEGETPLRVGSRALEILNRAGRTSWRARNQRRTHGSRVAKFVRRAEQSYGTHRCTP
jgi:hypothetical protein